MRNTVSPGSAAPVTRAILQYLLGEDVDPIIEGGQRGSPMPWDVVELPEGEAAEPVEGDVP